MFCECSNIIDIDFSKFKTEKVTDMSNMFYKCMFSHCSSITIINISSFNTHNVNNMDSMLVCSIIARS